jgi:hypothetical protein
VEGLNPKLIRIKLDAYIATPAKKNQKKNKAGADAKPARQAVAAEG